MGLFNDRTKKDGKTTVPVWFMRQAGRYHTHYQHIRKNHNFMEMCKNSDLATQITLGPIEDFKFNAAILFSDLLFPLEHLGMGLHYNDGPPKLAFTLEERSNFSKLSYCDEATRFYQFQGDACKKLKEKLPGDVTLLGFVGAPFTLFSYATCGSHAGALLPAKKGLYNGDFDKFLELLLPSLKSEIDIQLSSNADAICLFDTAAGELAEYDYKKYVSPVINELAAYIKNKFPDKKIIYYGKCLKISYYHHLDDKHIDVVGIDWRIYPPEAFKELSSKFYLQGNIDPCWLHLEWSELQRRLDQYKKMMDEGNCDYSRWIFGLGHGVLPKTPEENVRKTVVWVKDNLLY